MGTGTVSSNKRSKAIRSALAVGLALLLALGGTFAWTSVSQLALNSEEGTPNPGARLHDNFAGIGNDAYGTESTGKFANKDIFVENYSDEATVFARVKLYEYLKIGEKSIGKDDAVEETYTTWASLYADADADAAEAIAEYWTLNMGAASPTDTYYIPTFNKSNVSLAADVRGEGATTPDDAATGKVTTDKTYYTQEQMKSDGANNEVSDYEWAAADEGGTTVSKKGDAEVPHTAAKLSVGSTAVMPIGEWDGEADTWVYDPSDGYIYWSSPLAARETTSLLLDSVEMTDKSPSDAWAYKIQAVGQFVTAEEWGMKDGAPLFDTDRDDTGMSSEAYALLNRIAGKTTYTIDVKPANEATQAPKGTKLASIATVKAAAGGGAPAESSAAVTYTLEGNASASTTIDPSGLLTVGDDETDGATLEVTATVDEQPSAKASYTVTVGGDWKVALRNALTANESCERYGNSGASLVVIDGVEYNKLAVDDADKSALVLTRDVVKLWGGANSYHGRFDADSFAWDGSEAETWCNEAYYESLSQDVKDAIKEVSINTQKAFDSGDVTSTTDKVFFLTQSDVFGTYSDGTVNYDTPNAKYYTYGNKSLVPEDIRKTLTAKTKNNDDTLYQYYSWWWLRSPRYSALTMAVVGSGDSWNSGPSNSDYYSSTNGCARPAFWLNAQA